MRKSATYEMRVTILTTPEQRKSRKCLVVREINVSVLILVFDVKVLRISRFFKIIAISVVVIKPNNYFIIFPRLLSCKIFSY